MILDIWHETVYDYELPVDITQHLAYLKPHQQVGQNVLSTLLKVIPEPGYCQDSIDTFGNIKTYFSIETRHLKLKAIAKSRVQTQLIEPTLIDLSQGPSWEEVRQHHRYAGHQVIDSSADFLFSSPMILFDSTFSEFAKDCFTPGQSVLKATHALMQKIFQQMEYKSASTDVNTLAIDSLKNGMGVCQDFSHIMITCLRMLGLPAQYVSGYMLTQPPPGKPRLIGSDASHAWVALYVPAIAGFAASGWYHFDPTNDRFGLHAPGSEYVILSKGRDYSDVSPIRGVIHGGGQHTLAVAVTVLPVDEKTLN